MGPGCVQHTGPETARNFAVCFEGGYRFPSAAGACVSLPTTAMFPHIGAGEISGDLRESPCLCQGHAHSQRKARASDSAASASPRIAQTSGGRGRHFDPQGVPWASAAACRITPRLCDWRGRHPHSSLCELRAVPRMPGQPNLGTSVRASMLASR